MSKLDCGRYMWSTGSPIKILFHFVFHSKLMYIRCSFAFCQSPGQGKRIISSPSEEILLLPKPEVGEILEPCWTLPSVALQQQGHFTWSLTPCNKALLPAQEQRSLSIGVRQRTGMKCCPLYLSHSLT